MGVVRRDPQVMSGTAVFAGTRVPVQTLFDYLRAGQPLSEFLEDFPTVSRAQANAVLDRAKEALLATDRIAIDPEVMLGKPVIHGTRVPVELILQKLSEGATESALLDAYPGLSGDDIRAALRYGAAVIAHEDLNLFEGRKSTDK